MTENDNFAADLAAAEEALLKAEETHGKDHVQVSYCLDNVASLLRSKKIRTLDAANMEARAKAIRVKQIQGDKANETPQMRQISQTIKDSVARQQKQKRNKKLRHLAVASVLVLGVAQTVFLPTPEEKKLIEPILKAAKNFKPESVGKDFMNKATASAKEAAAKQQAHNDEIDQFVNQ